MIDLLPENSHYKEEIRLDKLKKIKNIVFWVLLTSVFLYIIMSNLIFKG